MKNVKLPNIAWIVVDSVRSYSGVNDSRNFLDIFYKLSEKGTRFFNVQTSAPSTIMSTSAMLSGIDSVMHSITYDGFDAKKNEITYLKDYISSYGYNTYLITFFPEGFKFLGDVFDGLTSRQSKKSPPENRFWSNREISDVLRNLINLGKIKEPFLLYVNYNCRNDPHTSLEVEKGINNIKSNFKSRDIYFILNSDHGYPDPSKNLTKKMALVGHDLVMTEDNITTPLIIIGNGFLPNKKVIERVGLIDISQLIKSLVNCNLTNSKLYKVSQGYNTNTIYKTWNRYIAQDKGQICSVKNNIKLIYDIDKNQSEFYRINNKIDGLNWKIIENKIYDFEQDTIIDEVHLLKKDLEKTIENTEKFFSDKLQNQIKNKWKLDQFVTICLVGKFTKSYVNVINNIELDHVKIKCISISEIFTKRNANLSIFSNRKTMYVYITYGVSITRWFREIFICFLNGYKINLFSNYSLERPQNLIFIFKYLPLLKYKIIKSFKVWGIKNTLKIILKKN